jgi:hypothetical protein
MLEPDRTVGNDACLRRETAGPGVLFPPPRVMRGAQERREKPKNVRF